MVPAMAILDDIKEDERAFVVCICAFFFMVASIWLGCWMLSTYENTKAMSLGYEYRLITSPGYNARWVWQKSGESRLTNAEAVVK